MARMGAQGLSGGFDVATGAWSIEKLEGMQAKWVQYVQRTNSELSSMAAAVGFELNEKVGHALLDEVLEATNFKDHKQTPTMSSELCEAGFHIGAVVKLMRRVSVPINARGNRKDIALNSIGKIHGYTNDKDAKIICIFEVAERAGLVQGGI